MMDASGRAAIFNSGRWHWHSAVIRDRKLTLSAQRVAQLLFDLQNVDRGFAWPSRVHIARELRISLPTVKRAIRQLEQRGWLAINRSRGRGHANEYRLAFGQAGSEQAAAE